MHKDEWLDFKVYVFKDGGFSFKYPKNDEFYDILGKKIIDNIERITKNKVKKY